jgi:hypothetical protein
MAVSSSSLADDVMAAPVFILTIGKSRASLGEASMFPIMAVRSMTFTRKIGPKGGIPP